MTATARLLVVLPVHNRRATTVRFVEALRVQTRRPDRLILVDDGSSDGTAAAVCALWPQAEVVTGIGDWWWAGALDQGCRHLLRTGVADDDILLFVNDDVVIAPDFLEQALTEFQPRVDTLLLARQRDADTGAELDHGGGVKVDLRELRFSAARGPEEIDCLPTRGLFLRWRDFRRTGGFYPRTLPHYLSDYEFTLRARRAGLRLMVARTAALGVKLKESGRSVADLFTETRWRRLGLLLSPRFKDNPVTWSVFAWLAAPPTRLPYLWLKIWVLFLGRVLRCVSAPVEDRRAG